MINMIGYEVVHETLSQASIYNRWPHFFLSSSTIEMKTNDIKFMCEESNFDSASTTGTAFVSVNQIPVFFCVQ
jgi:hypothetical protein